MNIFVLHWNTRQCAQMHCNKHVIKMILESCQLLCSAWHMIDPCHEIYQPCYKLTHKNHPCSIWVRQSTGNYKWLCSLAIELCYEYTYRYGKIHKSQPFIESLSDHVPPIENNEMTQMPLAMPTQYKTDDAVLSYRHYYIEEKKSLHNWTGKFGSRDIPDWIHPTCHVIF